MGIRGFDVKMGSLRELALLNRELPLLKGAVAGTG
jgi:hypothetical protein